MFKFILISICLLVLSGCTTCKKSAAEAQGDKGFKLVAVKKGSIYDRLGLEAGDVLTQYNSTAIRSPEDAMGFYETLKTESKVRIEFQRNGEPMVIESPLPSPKK